MTNAGQRGGGRAFVLHGNFAFIKRQTNTGSWKENEYKLFDKGEEKCGGTSRRKIVDIRIYEYIAKTWQVHRSLLRKTFSKLFGFD